MKEHRNIYDFCDDPPEAGGAGARISELMLDGWAAYYRWLVELEKATRSAVLTEHRRGPTRD